MDAIYPTIVRWVQENRRIEIGQDEMSSSFIRALDPWAWSGRAGTLSSPRYRLAGPGDWAGGMDTRAGSVST